MLHSVIKLQPCAAKEQFGIQALARGKRGMCQHHAGGEGSVCITR